MAYWNRFWAAMIVVGLAGLGICEVNGEEIPPGVRQLQMGVPAAPQIVTSAPGVAGGYNPYTNAGAYYPKSRWFRDDTAPYQHELTFGQGLYRPWIYKPRL